MQFQMATYQLSCAPVHETYPRRDFCIAPPRCQCRHPSKQKVRRHACRQVSAAFQAPQQEQQEAADPAQQGRKLARFSPKADIRRSLLNFQYEAEVDAGTLVIRPLSRAQLREVTDLLTDVFAASEDRLGLYTRYMRNQIRIYLENHLKVAPDAVVLVAVLLPHGASTSNSSAAGRPADAQLANSMPAGSEAAANPISGPTSTDSAVEGPAGLEATDGAAQQQRQRRRQQEVEDGVLVGTVEVSFTESTRTRFLTLNPPKDSAYLGNMCTAPEHRRRGYGSHLLRAAEQLTQLAAYPILYLHLRFKDVEAAAMYERAGYSEAARDMFLLPLLGLQRRFLMSRQMSQRASSGIIHT